MRLSRIALAVSFNLVIGFIVVPVNHQVNHKSNINQKQQQQLADGMPLPPVPPPDVSSNSLIADGMPLPPVPPPNAVGTTLSADGMPLPPIPPPDADGAMLVADGMPLPPVPPPDVNGIAALA